MAAGDGAVCSGGWCCCLGLVRLKMIAAVAAGHRDEARLHQVWVPWGSAAQRGNAPSAPGGPSAESGAAASSATTAAAPSPAQPLVDDEALDGGADHRHSGSAVSTALPVVADDASKAETTVVGNGEGGGGGAAVAATPHSAPTAVAATPPASSSPVSLREEKMRCKETSCQQSSFESKPLRAQLTESVYRHLLRSPRLARLSPSGPPPLAAASTRIAP